MCHIGSRLLPSHLGFLSEVFINPIIQLSGWNGTCVNVFFTGGISLDAETETGTKTAKTGLSQNRPQVSRRALP